MKKFFSFLFLIGFLFPSFVYAQSEEAEEPKQQEPKTEIVTLLKCVDGDTAHFQSETIEDFTARFLAVDTPESVHPTKQEEPFGKEASEYTCSTLTNAKEIRLEYDENSDEVDRYGRKLVWVFVDDVLLQKSLVELGYAEVAYLYDDYKYTPLLQDAEAIAKVNRVGIWSIDEQDTVTEEDSKEEVPVEDTKTEKKGFLDRLFDQLLASVVDFVDDLLEKLLNLIEDML